MKPSAYILRAFCLLFLAMQTAVVSAQTPDAFTGMADTSAVPADSVSAAACGKSFRPTTHQWLFGIGRLNVLDTYLSPLEYTGTELSVLHRSEREARWGGRRVTVTGLFAGRGAYLHSPTDDGKEWEGSFSAAGGWHYNLRPCEGLRLGVGGLMEATAGFTYNTRNGNNPAQGQLAADVALSLLAQYDFRIARRGCSARMQLDAPLGGVMFTPDYGQSYYEIFSLGHRHRNVRPTWVGNAPSARLLTTLSVRLLGATFSVGYVADVRQSHVNHLKRHAWHNQFVVGYVRRLVLFR